MRTKQLARLPFLAALIVGVAFMPLDIYDFHQREIGTAQVAPWRQKLSAAVHSVRTVWHALRAFLLAPGRAHQGLVAAVLLVAIVTQDNAAGFGFAVTVLEMRAERKRLSEQAQEILTKARNDNRDITKEEEAQFNKIHEDIDRIGKQVEREERQAAVEASLAESGGRRSEPPPAPGDRRDTRGGRLVAGAADMGHALRAWLLAPSEVGPRQEHRDAAQRLGVNLANRTLVLRFPAQTLRALRGMGPGGIHPDDIRDWREAREEERAQSVGTGSAGGFTAPDSLMQGLERAMLAFGGMRQVSTILRTDSGTDLPWPTSNDTSNEGAEIAENAAMTEQDVAFAQLVLQAFAYTSKIVRVSAELLQDSSVDISARLGEILGERLGRITNRRFTTGTGTGQPKGIVEAAVLGKTGATGQTTSVIYDDLVDLQHSVDPAYRVGARWMFNDATLKALKKIKVPQFSGDTAGMPLWQPGLALREPDTILGDPYTINQHVAVMAASAKSILYGLLSKYIIRDVRDITLIRLDERYAEFRQVAFVAWYRGDGDLLDAGTNPVKFYANSAT